MEAALELLLSETVREFNNKTATAAELLNAKVVEQAGTLSGSLPVGPWHAQLMVLTLLAASSWMGTGMALAALLGGVTVKYTEMGGLAGADVVLIASTLLASVLGGAARAYVLLRLASLGGNNGNSASKPASPAAAAARSPFPQSRTPMNGTGAAHGMFGVR